jgi:hypothetical protein
MNVNIGWFIVVFLLFIGTVLITIELTYAQCTCPPPKIIYRYVPRTFDEEQDEPVYPTDIFKAMFTQPSAWMNGVNDFEMRRILSPNKFYISQD